MFVRNVKSHLESKFKEWLASIEDPEVRSLAAKNTIISGGAIPSLLSDEKVNDYDLYFLTHETALAIAQYYVKRFQVNPPPRFKNSGALVHMAVWDREPREEGGPNRVQIAIKSAGIAGAKGDGGNYRYFEDASVPSSANQRYITSVMEVLREAPTVGDVQEEEPGENDPDSPELKAERKKKAEEAKAEAGKKYRPIFLSSNAITLSDQVQLIIRFYGTPEEVHANFDFAHCTAYWHPKTGLHMSEAMLTALKTKELVYMGSKYPLCSLIRTRKFQERGYWPHAGQYVKIGLQLGDMDLRDPAVLEDQLTGVDSAYFTELLTALRKDMHADPELDITSTYLCNLIDKLI